VQDTNGPLLIRRLRDRGIPLKLLTVVHDDVDAIVEAARRDADAGFDRIAFVQVGEDQHAFFHLWERSLRDRLAAELSGRSPALSGA
jgi:hypothetical protein